MTTYDLTPYHFSFFSNRDFPQIFIYMSDVIASLVVAVTVLAIGCFLNTSKPFDRVDHMLLFKTSNSLFSYLVISFSLLLYVRVEFLSPTLFMII